MSPHINKQCVNNQKLRTRSAVLKKKTDISQKKNKKKKEINL
jgi:hypothetical protein